MCMLSCLYPVHLCHYLGTLDNNWYIQGVFDLMTCLPSAGYVLVAHSHYEHLLLIKTKKDYILKERSVWDS